MTLPLTTPRTRNSVPAAPMMYVGRPHVERPPSFGARSGLDAVVVAVRMKNDKRIATDQVHVGFRGSASCETGKAMSGSLMRPLRVSSPPEKISRRDRQPFWSLKRIPRAVVTFPRRRGATLWSYVRWIWELLLKSTGDFVVVQQDGVVPPIDELREMRESQPFHLHARLHRLAAVLCRDLNRDALHGCVVDGGLAGKDGRELAMAFVERQMALQGAAIEELASLASKPAREQDFLLRGDRRDQNVGRLHGLTRRLELRYWTLLEGVRTRLGEHRVELPR